MGDGSPGSREAEGEGGEGFYIAQSGGCSDLLVIWGGEQDSGEDGTMLPSVTRSPYTGIGLGKSLPGLLKAC